MDITFNCDKCGQSLTIDEAGAGQLVDCPKCGVPLEVPYKSKPPVPSAPPPMPAPRMSSAPVSSPPPVSDTKKCPFCAEQIKAEAKVCRFCGYDFATGKRSPNATESAQSNSKSALPKILALVVLVALIPIMLGGFFAYNSRKDQQRAKAKAEAPFFVAAKEALDEAHKMQSAIGIGLTYEKHGEQLIALATKVDNVSRAIQDNGLVLMNPDAMAFRLQVGIALIKFKEAGALWEIERRGIAETAELQYSGEETRSKLKADFEPKIQNAWSEASEAVNEAHGLYNNLTAAAQPHRPSDDAGAWSRLGDAFLKCGSTNEAISAYQQAVKLKPDDALAWFRMGEVYRESGQTDEAGKALAEARRLKPDLFK